MISSPEYISDVRYRDGQVLSVFFMHQSAVKLCRTYNSVFHMDCTNKFQMPLLNIVGIACTYQTFNAGFAFLNSETEESFTWALGEFSKIVSPKVVCTDRDLALMNSLVKVFPSCKNLLCIWHINKNIMANCKKKFEVAEGWKTFISDWNSMIYVTSMVSLNVLFQFQQVYSSSHPYVWQYV